MDEFERAIEELEATITDPELESVLTDVKDFNEILKEVTIGTDESIKFIHTLNDRWVEKGFKNKNMYITGRVRVGGNYSYINDIDASDDTTTEYVNHEVKTYGFGMMNILEMRDGKLTQRQRIFLAGQIQVEDETGVGGILYENCCVTLDNDTLVECRELTPAKVGAWLSVYHQDLKLSIDQALIDANDEAEATLRLRDVPLTFDAPKKKDRKQLREYMEFYLNYYNSYEKNLAYLVGIFGECEVFDRDLKGFRDHRIMSERVPFIAGELSLRLNSDKTEFIPWINGSLDEGDKKTTRLIRMPLETIFSMESGRDIYKRA